MVDLLPQTSQMVQPSSPEKEGGMMKGQLPTDKPRLPSSVGSCIYSGGGRLGAHLRGCHLKDQPVDLSIKL